MASELTARRPERGDDWLDLRPVTIIWVTAWWDGPVEGMATYQGRDCWFRAIFDTGADEWTSARRCRLYELTPDERQRLWAQHRLWEQYAGGNCCYHADAPDPALRPGWETFYQHADHQPAQTGTQVGEFTAPLMQMQMQMPDGKPARAVVTTSPSRPGEGTVTGHFAPGGRWNIDLWPYDAIILSGRLMTVHFDKIHFEHKA